MANFKVGDQVTWVKKMAAVPHPEGKTDRDGNVLPVFRDLSIVGKIIEPGIGNTWFVRPNSKKDSNNVIHSERYYDVCISADLLSHI